MVGAAPRLQVGGREMLSTDWKAFFDKLYLHYDTLNLLKLKIKQSLIDPSRFLSEGFDADCTSDVAPFEYAESAATSANFSFFADSNCGTIFQ